jgi:hypothetical protein
LGRGVQKPAVRPTVKATVKVIRYTMRFHALCTVYCMLYMVYWFRKRVVQKVVISFKKVLIRFNNVLIRSLLYYILHDILFIVCTYIMYYIL